MTSARRGPPPVAEWILRKALPDDTVGWSIRGDLRQELEELRRERPRRSFRLWYWRQALALALRWRLQPLLERVRLRPGGSPPGEGTPFDRRTGRPSHPGPPSPSPTRRRRTMPLDSLTQDLRYGLRTLRVNPTFTVVAVLTLALGIGATAGVFSVVNAVLLRPLRLPDADRLVMIKRHDLAETEASGGNTTPGNFEDWRRQATSFEAMAAIGRGYRILEHAGESRRVTTMSSAGSIHEVLGTPVTLGRPLRLEDDESGERVAVASHALWRTLFGGDPEVIGTSVDLGGEPYTVVGVADPALGSSPLGMDVDLWVPSGWSEEYRQNRTNYAHEVVARLRPDIELEQAQREMESIMAGLREAYPQQNADHGVVVAPLHGELVGDFEPLLLMLLAAVTVVLLIACVNLANLLLARATARRSEIAVRKAVGASAGRLIRQVLTESVLLALLGGAVGILLCDVVLELVVALLPPEIPYLDRVTIDWTVLGFIFLAATLAGCAFGLLPALRLARSVDGSTLREARGSSDGGGWTLGSLVVAEVALSVMLLSAAGLLVRTLDGLRRVDPGFTTRNLLTFQVTLPAGLDSRQRIELWRSVNTELDALPGVESAAIANQLPSSVNRVSGWFDHADRPTPRRDRSYLIPYRLVSPGYSATMEIPLLRGRRLDDRDGGQAPGAMINEAVVDRFFPDRDPLGERITLGSLDADPWFPPLTVVGILGDVRNDGLGGEPAPTVYLPFELAGWTGMVVALRASADPAAVIGPAREVVRRLEPGAAIWAVQTAEQMYAAQVAPTRSVMLFLLTLATLGLVMAAVGVFGVLSYSVGRRTREMGIRIALGASPRDLSVLVVGQAVSRVALGTALGTAAAVVGNRLLESMLFGVSPADPPTLTAVAGLLLLVAILAAVLPARRAASVEALVALRAE